MLVLFLINSIYEIYILSLSLSFILILGFSQGYSLKDFYKSDIVLDNKTDSIFNLLNDTSRVGQMIVPAIGRLGKSRDHVLALAKKDGLEDTIIEWYF